MRLKEPNTITLTGMPTECSACGGQYSDRRHVDFDSAVDRGYAQLSGGNYANPEMAQTFIAADDLILCDQCVATGARLIGMVDGQELKAVNEQLERENEQLSKRAEKAENYADRMEEALGTLRAKPVRLDHRQKPRQKPTEDLVA